MASRLWWGLGLGAGAWAGYRLFKRRLGPSLDGQVALVTGGSRGLGVLVARELARHGCDVAICARDEEELERARVWLAREGTKVLALPCDVSDPEQVEWLVERTLERFGRVDLLVNVAGIIQAGPEGAMTLEDYEHAMRIDFFGVVHTTEQIVPHMREQGAGRIVNITSIGGKVAVPHLLPYDCAKFAAQAYSEGMRAELSGSGISVTTIVPGLMRTGSVPHVIFKGQHEKEKALFGVIANMPLLTVAAERAAARIVEAARWREAEVVIGVPAKTLRVVHDVFPGTTARVLGIASRILPRARGEAGEKTPRRGKHVSPRIETHRD